MAPGTPEPRGDTPLTGFFANRSFLGSQSTPTAWSELNVPLPLPQGSWCHCRWPRAGVAVANRIEKQEVIEY